MIACSFPPLGGPGVQRSVKFVKYLRDFGYEPIVFTRECKNEDVMDETLLKDIPDGVIAVGNPCRVIRKIAEEDWEIV